MTPADRQALIRVAKSRGKLAEDEIDARAKTVLAEVLNDLTAEYQARDALWNDAVVIAEEAAAKANEQIRLRCAELGIPADHAPGLDVAWHKRGAGLSDRARREELRELAQARVSALTATAKTIARAQVLDIEEKIVLGALESIEAKKVLEAMPSAEQLMPTISIHDLGVTHWQPPEDIAAQAMTPLTPAQRRVRQIRRAIVANPEASDRAIARLVGCDHKTVAAHRLAGGESAGELPAGVGELPTEAGEVVSDE